MSQKRSVAVLLSSREQFSPYYGGALARWTYEVYRHLTATIDAHIFGFPTAEHDRYPLPHHTSAVAQLCKAMAHIPRVRRYEEEVWLRVLLRQIKQFEIIHIHNRPQWIPLLRKLNCRQTIILHLQNNHLGHWPADQLDRFAPQLDGLAVCSQFLKDTFAARSSALAEKTAVVHNGVDTELFHPNEGQREPKTIFFVGRFDQEKGILELVNAYSRVLSDYPDAVLQIGGATGFGTHRETPYVRQVRELADSLTKTRGAKIQFPGYIHHDRDLPGFFQRASLFTSPSLFQEPFGLVNAEAMACGTPVVGSTRGGIPEVLGDAGLLVNPENAEEYAAALSSLLADSAHRKQLGQRALERCRAMFDWRVIARHWEEFLDRFSRT